MIRINDKTDFDSAGRDEGLKILAEFQEWASGPNGEWIRDSVPALLQWLRGELPEALRRLGEPSDVSVRSVVTTEDVVHIRVVFGSTIDARTLPEEQRRRVWRVGEVVGGGLEIVIRPAPQGGYTIQVSAYTEVLVCTNGMTQRQPQRSWNIRTDSGELPRALGRLLAQLPTLASLVCRAIARLVEGRQRRIGSVEEVLAYASTRTGLPENVVAPVYCAFAENPGSTEYDIVNAVSRAANDIVSRREHLSRTTAQQDRDRLGSLFTPDAVGELERQYLALQNLTWDILDLGLQRCSHCGSLTSSPPPVPSARSQLGSSARRQRRL